MESAQFMNEDEINIALITWIYDNQAKAVQERISLGDLDLRRKSNWKN